MPKAGKIGLCLFCPGTKLTDEHIWPDWIVREFKKRKPPRRGLYKARHVRSDGRLLEFPAGSIERKEPLVCDPCNSWMSQVETCAIPFLKPLIFGPNAFTSLGPDAICTLAAWFTLRSMVFDGMLEPSKRYYLQADRTRFATDPLLEPATHTHLWLALYRGNEPLASRFYVHNWLAGNGEHLQVFSGLINNLAFKFVAWKGERGLDSISWTPSERWLRCPAWIPVPPRAAPAGASRLSSRPRPSAWCSMKARASRAWRESLSWLRPPWASGSSTPAPTARTAAVA